MNWRTYLAVLREQQLGHQEAVRDETHPGEGKAREVYRLQATQRLTIEYVRNRTEGKQDTTYQNTTKSGKYTVPSNASMELRSFKRLENRRKKGFCWKGSCSSWKYAKTRIKIDSTFLK